MAEVLAYLAIAAVPDAFVLARIVVGLGYRASRAPEPAVSPNPLHAVRGQHPAILAALMGHPDCGDGGAWEERQLFDCALATLMDLSARGVLRMRTTSPSCRSESMLDPLDSLAIEVLLPEDGARPGSRAVRAADLLAWVDKHWGEVIERLTPFHAELERRLWQESYLEASFRQAAILACWPFRLMMLWLLAGFVGLVASLVDREGPAVLL